MQRCLIARQLFVAFVMAQMACWAMGAVTAASAPTEQRLRVVGGLAAPNQFTRHEAPFWTTQLPQLSGGRYRADIVPFDRAGIRAPELLSMVKLGTVPFGTLSLAIAAPRDLALGAVDLAGLNPDMASLKRVVAAFRPELRQLLADRHGIELLAVYTYPAQVLFCKRPITGLDSIKGLRVRTASPSQADWVEALGGQPVNTAFGEIVSNMRAGQIDCAITGTMSGNTIGLHEHTTHLHTMAVSWGLSVFLAHGPTWQALPADLKTLLLRELPKLEARIWDESSRETDEGIACNVGVGDCRSGRRGRMAPVRPTPADQQRQREALATVVLPRWLQRCGPDCADLWRRTLGPATGVDIPVR